MVESAALGQLLSDVTKTIKVGVKLRRLATIPATDGTRDARDCINF